MPRKKAEKSKTIVITWKHSTIGRAPVQRATIAALGFKHLNQSLTKADIPSIRGMIKTVEHLVEVKEEA